ncbi:predicted protein [Plenodomus lingam JN3]|uniref:Predicted protein n=1 Tax=Leptosphaeria maculans (strain JN3 / isolate v23.1.3 / race Av1-4-5-6-7-8) TaxID=985895 RepID=E4ZQF9_LEPMJ|nr:predicted protein [Plenodomus lingam JN3]CBX93634.1 predicted protein [Plenodomus lingam JN3]
MVMFGVQVIAFISHGGVRGLVRDAKSSLLTSERIESSTDYPGQSIKLYVLVQLKLHALLHETWLRGNYFIYQQTQSGFEPTNVVSWRVPSRHWPHSSSIAYLVFQYGTLFYTRM